MKRVQKENKWGKMWSKEIRRSLKFRIREKRRLNLKEAESLLSLSNAEKELQREGKIRGWIYFYTSLCELY
ncbi:MAG: hypothetical protein NZ903_03110 [Candidatus Micrarchaeota archaeon]|nr:hypothetical protein [Candidatus Micrarchaeota archaeon]